MKNIKVNYTDFSGKRTSTTINGTIANVYYRESNLEKFKETLYNRRLHEQELRRIIQTYVNEQHKDEDDETSTWEGKEMIESSLLEDIVFHAKANQIRSL